MHSNRLRHAAPLFPFTAFLQKSPAKPGKKQLHIQGGRSPIGDVRLRAHHLLCIQGFRGQGYSPQFIANLARVIHRLQTESDLKIRIVAGVDDLCLACPHVSSGSCTCPDQDVCGLDDKVLQRLEINIGEAETWLSLLGRISDKVGSDYIRELCADCRWLEYDYCTGGIEALRYIRAPETYRHAD